METRSSLMGAGDIGTSDWEGGTLPASEIHPTGETAKEVVDINYIETSDGW